MSEKRKKGEKSIKYSHGRVYLGDCLKVMRRIPDNSYSAILTDPPYGLFFMNKDWDKALPSKYIWQQAFRILKPGGVLLCFGGTRTYHRLACMIEDAGFELKDCIMWLYGSGFPKSHAIGKSIDKKFGKERKVLGVSYIRNGRNGHNKGLYGQAPRGNTLITKAATKIASVWDGYGTALKPAWEPVIVGFKPTEGSFADNALKWGVGGLNIEASRIKSAEALVRPISSANNEVYGKFKQFGSLDRREPSGRWPANVILDECAAKLLDEQTGIQKSGVAGKKSRAWGAGGETVLSSKEDGVGWKAYGSEGYNDIGGASRFFYCAKASKGDKGGEYNKHPTCKPTKLIEYLLKLVTMPKNTRILDPFCGSGTTLVAAQNLDLRCDGIEINPEYVKIIKKRLEK